MRPGEPNRVHVDPEPAASGAAATEIGGYTLLELLGRGGMGEVWRAEGVGADGVRRRVALKRILPRLRVDPQVRERFLTEARTSARLDHPNITRVIDVGETPEPFLALEFVDGITAADVLRELSRARSRLPAVAAAYLCAEVARGLDHAHRLRDAHGRPLGIVHRDVSPANVLIATSGAVKITDFGVARAADSTVRTEAGMSVGKLVYMSPEQARGGPVDARADVFALGVTLWELLALGPLLPRHDAAAAMRALSSGALPPPSQAQPQLPPAVDALVMRALAHDPAQRYPTAGAFADALAAFVHSLAPAFNATALAAMLSQLLPPGMFAAATARSSPLPQTVVMPAAALPSTIAQPAFAAPPLRSAPRAPDLALGPPRAHAVAPWLVVALVAAVAVLSCVGLAAAMLLRRDRGAPNVTAAVPLPLALAPPKPPEAADRDAAPVFPFVAAVPAEAPSPARAPASRRSAAHGAYAVAEPIAAPEDPSVALERRADGLRNIVRACTATTEGSGARVRVTFTVDGPSGAVTDVDVKGDAVPAGSEPVRCVAAAARDALRGLPPRTAPVRIVREFRY